MNNMPITTDETTAFLIREHWIRFVPALLLIMVSWIIYILCGTASAAVETTNHVLSLWIIVVGHVFLLAFHHLAFYRYLSWSTRQYLLTNRRILGSEQKLWFKEEIIDIPLGRLRAVEARRDGLLQNLLNYGTIVFKPEYIPSLPHIPHPERVHAHIMEQIHAVSQNDGKNEYMNRSE